MLRPGQIIHLVVIGLLALAVVMIHSAGMAIGSGATSFTDVLFSRHAAYAVGAVFVMLIASRLDVRAIFHQRGLLNPLWLLVLIALGLTVYVLLFGQRINGVRRWGNFMGVSFQPSELIKWTMIIVIAWWCARRQSMMHRFWHGLLPPMLLLGLATGLIIINDLGTAALIALVSMLLLFAGGARWWHLATIVPAAAGAVIVAIAQSPYRRARITSFLDPWADPEGTGYHAIQSMVAIAGGGLTGRGLGAGIQKFGYLPEDTTDFVFAIVCEELGFPGACVVVVFYLILIWVGFNIVRNCRDVFGRLLALGILLTIGLQALMNLAVVAVLVPTKGIALPLLSAGGTGWILTAGALGMLVALDEANRMETEGTSLLPEQPLNDPQLRPQPQPQTIAAVPQTLVP